MRRLAGLLVALLAVGAGVALASSAGGGDGADPGTRLVREPSPVQVGDDGVDPRADVEPPRVCWFSDYDGDPPGLRNRCRWDEERREWLIEVNGAWKPAKGRRLPVANLCHYFHGLECPKR